MQVNGISPKQADRLIKNAQPVTVRTAYGETVTLVFVARDRFNLRTADGGVFDRTDLEVVEDARVSG